MKKKIFGGILAVAIAAVAAVNVNINNESEDALSALSLANVEALANGESGGGYTGCTSGGGYCAIYWQGTLIFSSYSHYPY
ncbi:NVEALA domain-containing protein [Sphingobacterium sp. FBM7-1]|uniref:NVEALA domain-containing protein n=1 Tax=Sphingobacterium sp. FBM7-1 TaxID=2886688 RepID=UPI001D11462F|nr:NVEALA domain-containing protein [Sphingobacterium sp. FBM7-1]MCC2599282.1 NVEALA domain-containing protein [Sphingobacterium sp. FBM7-1]